MKKITMLFLAFAFVSALLAQNADDVVGTWLTQDGDSKVEIVKKTDGKYEGKIVWLKEPFEDDGTTEKLDDENPDPKLKTRPIMGLPLLKNFVFDDDEWDDGTIYDPKSGKTYSCYMWFDDSKDVLFVKGFIGVSLIGKKVSWERVK